MSIEKELYTRLSGFGALTSLLGAATHIFPNVIPQGKTLPAISYQRITTDRVSAMGADRPDVIARFQVTVWAGGGADKNGYADAKAVAAQIRAALERYSVTGPDATIQDIFFINEFDLYDDAARAHGVACDFRVHYEE